jgi:hypothetical protein
MEQVNIREGADLENYIKISANSVGELRKVDVYRVIDSLRSDNLDGVSRSDLATFIVAKRPDLAAEVTQVMLEEFPEDGWTPDVGADREMPPPNRKLQENADSSDALLAQPHVGTALRIGLRALEARARDREAQERAALAAAFNGSVSPVPEFRPSGFLVEMQNDIEYLKKLSPFVTLHETGAREDRKKSEKPLSLLLHVPVIAFASAKPEEIRGTVQRLIDAGLADAADTLKSGEGDIDAALLATDLNIGAPTVAIASHGRLDPIDADHEFKNFHRLLCERFDYVHDPVDWKRDQLSLVEWIANGRLRASST